MTIDNLLDAWVKAQSTLLFSEYVRLAKNYTWASSLKGEALAQWNLLYLLCPDIPPFITDNARTFVEKSLSDYYMKNYLLPIMTETYTDEDGFVWSVNETFMTPFGAEQFPNEGQQV